MLNSASGVVRGVFQEIAPSLDSYWRAIVLFGRNVASYKFAFGQNLNLLGPALYRTQRPRALVMSVLREFHLPCRDAEILQDAMLKFVFEYLLVAINDELTLDEVENYTAPRPLLVFSFMYDGGESIRRASGSPTFPEIIVAIWAGEEVSVQLSVG